MRQMLVVVSTGLLLLGACGGSDDGDGESADDREASSTSDGSDGGSDGGGGGGQAGAEEYVDAIATSIATDEGGALDEEVATCVANAIVDLVGVDVLHEADVSPDELAEAESLAALDVEAPDDAADRLGDDFDACGVGEPLTSALVSGATAGASRELSADVSACLHDSMDRQALARALATSFLGEADEDFQAVMNDAFAACPEALTALVLADAPGEANAEDEACVAGVVEENTDLVRTAVLEDDQEASDELAGILSDACPGVIGD